MCSFTLSAWFSGACSVQVEQASGQEAKTQTTNTLLAWYILGAENGRNKKSARVLGAVWLSCRLKHSISPDWAQFYNKKETQC